MKERKWASIPVSPEFKGTTISAKISKFVMRLVRHYDQDERDSDGAVHWNSIVPKLLAAFGNRGARKCSDTDWLHNIYKGSSKTRFEYCFIVSSCNSRTHWWTHRGTRIDESR